MRYAQVYAQVMHASSFFNMSECSLSHCEALSEIAFGPEMLNHRIEKERKVSQGQWMHTTFQNSE